MVSSDAQKRRYAHDSWAFNQRDPLVRKMFPTLLESPEPLPELPPAPGASAGSCRSFPDEVSRLLSIIKMGGALAIDGCRLSAVGVCGLAAEKGGADGAGGGGESACGDWGAGTVRAPAQLAHPGPWSSSSSFAQARAQCLWSRRGFDLKAGVGWDSCCCCSPCASAPARWS